ncbi:MAG: hypothetical protein M2R45_03042 [Verrucomicrobia subdivision 3 bacterium]|nr:hypothetical protein [Limisphaerales bacterium]MCS1415563.1 hypothetical protein [Limisphaerales bacterium]
MRMICTIQTTFWNTGKVPQKKRRGEINAFKNDFDYRRR